MNDNKEFKTRLEELTELNAKIESNLDRIDSKYYGLAILVSECLNTLTSIKNEITSIKLKSLAKAESISNQEYYELINEINKKLASFDEIYDKYKDE